MTTNSNGNWLRVAVSCFATASWCLSPVPVSPMTANFTEPALFGSVSLPDAGAAAGADEVRWSCAAIDGVEHATATSTGTNRYARRMFSPLLNRVRHEVDDDVRLDVADDQVLPDDAVLELLGQLRQVHEHLGRRGRQRRLRRVDRVHLEDDRLLPFFLALLGVLLQLVLDVGFHRLGAPGGTLRGRALHDGIHQAPEFVLDLRR